LHGFLENTLKNFSLNLKTNNQQPIIRPKMPELDSLRGIAIIMVLFAHGFFWIVANGPGISKFQGLAKFFILATQGGALGVNLFFVLSGFLITGILLDSRERPDYYKRFYANRALRILPAYLALLCVLLIFGIAQWPFLAISAFFMANFAPIFGVAMQYGPLWTLAVEEQFYLFWPQAVRRVSKKTLAIIALAIAISVPIIDRKSVV
jgi:peptidoglycan/LPS O-acetylase OafA/YrhL